MPMARCPFLPIEGFLVDEAMEENEEEEKEEEAVVQARAPLLQVCA